MYCQINKLLPISIISNTTRNEDVHHFKTRNGDLKHYTHRRTAQVSKTLSSYRSAVLEQPIQGYSKQIRT